jgi:hypothetical protein
MNNDHYSKDQSVEDLALPRQPKQRRPRPPQKNFPRTAVVCALKRTRGRLAQVADQAAQATRREALAKGVELDTTEMRAAIQAQHDMLLLIVCGELHIDPKEIGIDSTES